VYLSLSSSLSAALLRQITYGTIKIGIYQKIKRLFAEDIRRAYSFYCRG